jgi:hypothetical protein
MIAVYTRPSAPLGRSAATVFFALLARARAMLYAPAER